MKTGLWACAFLLLMAIAKPQGAQALIIWGYDGSPQMEKQYRYMIVDYGPQCMNIRRNQDPSFILSAFVDDLSAIGTRVSTSTPLCVTGVDQATVTLITPKHLSVSEHYGIWGNANTFAFVGTDNRMYLARNKPGFVKLVDVSAPALNRDLALVELETALPPAVVPMHIANFTQFYRQQVTQGMPSYHVGNMHLNLNYPSWNSYGNSHYKGIGTNKVTVTSFGYISHFYKTEGSIHSYLRAPANPASQDWADYWRTDLTPMPPVGTGFVRVNDSSAQTMIAVRDSANRLRVHVMGLHWFYNSDSLPGFVFQDIVNKLAAYNQLNGTSYTVNNPQLIPQVAPPTRTHVKGLAEPVKSSLDVSHDMSVLPATRGDR